MKELKVPVTNVPVTSTASRADGNGALASSGISDVSLQDRIRAMAIAAKTQGRTFFYSGMKMNYAGTVVEVGLDYILLHDAAVVLDVGDFTSPNFTKVVTPPLKQILVWIDKAEAVMIGAQL